MLSWITWDSSINQSILKRVSKDNLKDVTVILGGNLAVSYNVLLKKSDVDFCVIGEGEETIVELCNYFLSQEREWFLSMQ